MMSWLRRFLSPAAYTQQRHMASTFDDPPQYQTGNNYSMPPPTRGTMLQRNTRVVESRFDVRGKASGRSILTAPSEKLRYAAISFRADHRCEHPGGHRGAVERPNYRAEE